MSSFYTEEELSGLGLKSFGTGVLISRKASIYSPGRISIGDNVRIDDFCILSGHITMGSYIHISAYAALYGAMGIIMEDYTGVSVRSTIFSAMDDMGGDYLVGPTISKEYTNVTGSQVILKRYSYVCANSMLFPGVILGEGSVVGASSLVKYSTDDWGMYAGVPAKKIKDRSDKLKRFVK